MDKAQREVYDYAKYMLERGDALGYIRTYLNRESSDEVFIEKTMDDLKILNKSIILNRNNEPQPSKSKVSPLSFIFGLILLFCAVLMHFMMKSEGLLEHYLLV